MGSWGLQATYGHDVQITQRAESIHHAVKKKTFASRLLTQLGDILLKSASGVEVRSWTCRARDLLVATIGPCVSHLGHMVAIQKLEGKISCHAMDIIILKHNNPKQ